VRSVNENRTATWCSPTCYSLLATRRAVSRDRVTRSLEIGSCVSFRCNSNRRRLPALRRSSLDFTWRRDVLPAIVATENSSELLSNVVLVGANIRERRCGTLLHPDASALPQGRIVRDKGDGDGDGDGRGA